MLRIELAEREKMIRQMQKEKPWKIETRKTTAIIQTLILRNPWPRTILKTRNFEFSYQ